VKTTKESTCQDQEIEGEGNKAIDNHPDPIT